GRLLCRRGLAGEIGRPDEQSGGDHRCGQSQRDDACAHVETSLSPEFYAFHAAGGSLFHTAGATFMSSRLSRLSRLSCFRDFVSFVLRLSCLSCSTAARRECPPHGGRSRAAW